MHRLLTLGITAMIVFVGFQIGRMAPQSAKSDRRVVSLDLSPSEARQTIERRYRAIAVGSSN